MTVQDAADTCPTDTYRSTVIRSGLFWLANTDLLAERFPTVANAQLLPQDLRKLDSLAKDGMQVRASAISKSWNMLTN